MDGVLTRAIEQGHWVLLESVNLCNPAVLDRLNSLLEPGGGLLLNEAGTTNGQARLLRPHPDFRVFMTMNARQGRPSLLEGSLNCACLVVLRERWCKL